LTGVWIFKALKIAVQQKNNLPPMVKPSAKKKSLTIILVKVRLTDKEEKRGSVQIF